MQRHNAQFYGRPKSQVTSLLDAAVRSTARAQKKQDTIEDHYLVALASLSAEDRRAILRYVEAALTLEGITTFKYALEWVLGEGLDTRTYNKNFKVLWGEEHTIAYKGQGRDGQ